MVHSLAYLIEKEAKKNLGSQEDNVFNNNMKHLEGENLKNVLKQASNLINKGGEDVKEILFKKVKSELDAENNSDYTREEFDKMISTYFNND